MYYFSITQYYTYVNVYVHTLRRVYLLLISDLSIKLHI